MRFMVTQPAENQPHYLRGFAKDGNREWVEQLLDAGVDVNDKDEHGMTALHLACSGGQKEMVELLLKRHADIAAINRDNQTVFHLVAANGNLDILNILLQKANSTVLNQKTKNTGHSALHYASRNGHPEVCRLLLQNGAEKHIPDLVRLAPVKYAKNEETKKVFDEPLPKIADVQMPAPTPTKVNPTPSATIESRPSRSQDTKENVNRPGRSKSTDSPRNSKPKETKEIQRREQSEDKHKREPINANAGDVGRGEINRNEFGVFSEGIAKRQNEVGSVVVDKKKGNEAKGLKDQKVSFSDAHKKRMQMSVFDRLAGGSRNKK